MTKTFKTSAIIIIGFYVAMQIFADVGSLRILRIASFSIDGGTLVYPITFTLRDLVHKQLGKRAARTLILLAAALNVVMALFFWLISVLPADTSVGAQVEFNTVLGPVWRIVFASIVAEVVAELIDTEAYHFYTQRLKARWQWGRVLFSNAFSVPIDSFTFCFLAFYGILPTNVVLSIVWSNILVKGGITLFSIPLIYSVKENQTEMDS